MHVYFWILNSVKTFIFYFSNNFLFYSQFLIFEKHYFAFSSIISSLQTIQLICI
ncbi:hypothetical protein TSAR_009204 [Trichomalopsis sarcophagae]|uniref:Uncharacterized protein n=1 Tax=Trichomalopsis sarcophagae TaxID=543379 RepID=A0A232EQU9_9HYME|nr:hypothetical protein TSAR_009204 [Trichomalopsis sarcophagae]